MSIKDKQFSDNLTILAIDDEETVLKLYENILSADGHRVVKVTQGSQALKVMEEESFDLVFLDLKLPDMDGTELLKKIRSKLEWAPVVIVTGNPSIESTIEAIRAGGVYEYIIKPFRADDIQMTVRRAMEKAALSIENKRLIKKLEITNQALLERVDELQKFAEVSVDYEKKITDLQKKVEDLGNK